eukprot:6245647-Amphidinium_carterae.1
MGAKIITSKGSVKDDDLKDTLRTGIVEDVRAQSINYYSWVPSEANIADWPTRGQNQKLVALGVVRVKETFPQLVDAARAVLTLLCGG